MELEDKHLKLLNLLIHDKRIDRNGMLCSIEIEKFGNSYWLSYRALFDGSRYNIIHIEDIEKGNVVFLIPYGVGYMEEEFAKMGEEYKQIVKEFFGDNFREDMIMEISEEERQAQIREREKAFNALYNWDNKCYIDNSKKINVR